MSRVQPIFLDSGAVGWFREFKEYLKSIEDRLPNVSKKEMYEWFDSAEFREYGERYAQFLKEHDEILTAAVVLDAIHNADLSWEFYQFFEKIHNLKLVPVVHAFCDLKWVDHYLEHGCEYIALGGAAGKIPKNNHRNWLRAVFDRLTDSSGMPIVKVHGLASTGFEVLKEFPFTSVDSSSWIQQAGMACKILVPKTKHGEFRFDVPPQTISMSERLSITKKGYHYLNQHRNRQKEILRWIESFGYGLEDVAGSKGSRVRAEINIVFFECYRQSLTLPRNITLDYCKKNLPLVSADDGDDYFPEKTLIFYSGGG